MINSSSQKTSQFFKEISAYLRATSEHEVNPLSAWQIGIFSFVMLLSIFLALKNYDQFQIGAYQDDASYTVLAQSFIKSEAYGLMNAPDYPLPTRYPFGYPLLLSPFVLLFPNTPDMLKILSLLATIINSLLIFFAWPYFSQIKSNWWALGVATFYLLSPLVIGHTRMVMSEPVFTTLVLFTIILIEKYLAGKDLHGRPIFFLGIVMTLTVFTRTIGVTLAIAAIIRVLLLLNFRSKITKIIVYLTTGGLFLLILVTVITPVRASDLPPSEYINQYEVPAAWGAEVQVEGGVVTKFTYGFLTYTKQVLRDTIFPVGGGQSEVEMGRRFGIPNLPLLTGVTIGVFILVGLFYSIVGQGLRPTVIFFELFYLVIVFIWPWQGPRFLYPIFPFLTVHFLTGLELLISSFWKIQFFPKNLGKYATPFSLIFIFAVISALFIYKGLSDTDKSIMHVRDLRIGSNWIKENSSPDSLLMAQQPQGIYIYSDRHTVDFPAEIDSATDFETVLRTNQVDYILIGPEMIWQQDGSLAYDQFTSKKVIPILSELQQQQKIKLVYQSINDLVTIYEIK